ncbi:MAG: enoyl-CoA hydratase/isomerase family protein [Bacteroidia bacterium]
MENGYVNSKIENGIATITFFHPQSNSLPGEILRTLAHEIEAMGNNPEARVIILKSESPPYPPEGGKSGNVSSKLPPSGGGGAFCAGASFDELIAIKDIETGKRFFSGFAQVINAMRKAPKFIVARVQGRAVGGGVGIAAAADYTFAHESAAIKLSELAVGIGPFVVGPAIERKIGTAAFSQLAINASEWHDSTFAKHKGLYANVFKLHDEMDAAILLLAQKLAESSPEAMKMLKKVLWEGTEHWDKLLLERAEMSGTLVLSDFTKRFIASFKNK